jgi:outer membrane PBP1 activator LpoA protein
MVAHALLLAGDTARAETLLARAEDVPAAPRDVRAGPLLRAQIAAVRGDAEAAAQWLRHATRLGAREVRSLRADPVFARVRGNPGFEAAVVEQERLVARERREAIPLLDRGPGSND